MQLSAPINVLKLARSESKLQESAKVISRHLSVEVVVLLSHCHTYLLLLLSILLILLRPASSPYMHLEKPQLSVFQPYFGRQKHI